MDAQIPSTYRPVLDVQSEDTRAFRWQGRWTDFARDKRHRVDVTAGGGFYGPGAHALEFFWVDVAQAVCVATLWAGTPLEAWPNSLLIAVCSTTDPTRCTTSLTQKCCDPDRPTSGQA